MASGRVGWNENNECSFEDFRDKKRESLKAVINSMFRNKGTFKKRKKGPNMLYGGGLDGLFLSLGVVLMHLREYQLSYHLEKSIPLCEFSGYFTSLLTYIQLQYGFSDANRVGFCWL